MKKYGLKILLFPILILMLLIATWVLFPRSLVRILGDDSDDSILIAYSTNRTHTTEITQLAYQFTPGSSEYSDIRQILEQYYYHFSCRTMTNDASLRGNDAGFWLQIYCGDNNIICGGTGEIVINGKIFSIGYWGNSTSLDFMDSIQNVLRKIPPAQ